MANGTIKKNGMGWQLLWTNPSPSSNFDAQTVTFDDDYDMYMVFFYRLKDETLNLSTIFPHGQSVVLTGGSGYQNKVYTREATWHNGGGLEFSVCFAGSGSTANNTLIPTAIYGIRL